MFVEILAVSSTFSLLWGIGLPEIGHKGRDAKNYLKRGGSHKSGDGKFSKRKKCFVEKNKSNSLVKKYIKNINNFQI